MAVGATLRAATVIPLTAIYATALTATSIMVRTTMTFVLSLLPPSMRFFLQPLLILYYVPLFVLRSLTGPTRKQEQQTNLLYLQDWQDVVEPSQTEDDYWPTNSIEEYGDGKRKKTWMPVV